MSITMLTTDGIVRTMKNCFDDKTNISANWSASIYNEEKYFVIRCTINKEEVEHKCDMNLRVNKKGFRVSPRTLIADAVIFFKEEFKDAAEEPKQIEEPKAEKPKIKKFK